MREIKRGDVYYIRFDRSYGHEIATGRPAVIVSSKDGIDKSYVVQVCFLTTTPKFMKEAVPCTSMKGREGWVVCNQLSTVDKDRIENYSHSLTDEEMAKVDQALLGVLGLNPEPQQDEQMRKELEAYRELSEKALNELAELRMKKPDNSELRVELEMYKRLYEKAMDKIVELKIEKDSTPKIPYINEPKKAIIEDLRKLKEESEIEIIQEEKPKFKPNTIDINTAKLNDFVKAGIHHNYAKKIIEFREEVGGFDKVEDVLCVDGVGERFLQRHGSKLTVESESKIVIDKPKTSDNGYQVDLNNGTWMDFDEAKVSRNYAQKIMKYRRNGGKFNSVDDLIKVDGIGATFIENNRHKMRV